MRRLDRNERTPKLVDVPRDFGAVVRGQYVVAIGCGSVGLPASDILARVGVGRLLLVDPARLKPASVLTHPCWPEDLDRPKAVVAGERAKAVSPDTQVFAFDGAFDELPTHVLAEATYLFLASDNLLCEASVSQRALHLGIPVLQGSVYGPTLSAQVRSIASSESGDGPCLCCAFGEREWEDLDRGTRFSCTGPGASPGAAADPARIPTASLPHLCSMAANLLSNCTMDHARHRLEPRARDLGHSAPRELLRQAGYEGADPCRVTLTVEGFCFASLALCGCDVHPTLGRFVPTGSTAGACSHCGRPRKPHPMHTHDEVLVNALTGRLDRTLESLGTSAPTSVRVRGEGGAVLFHRRFAQAGRQAGAQR
jgi:molybdopterin/thiamine biosynthesis adenylyltransferase